MPNSANKLLVRQRTMLASALRAHLAEFGIIAPHGIHRVEKLAPEVHDPAVAGVKADTMM
jgi:transposase